MADEGERPDFIPCITIVRRGMGNARPERVKATKEELKEIIKEMKDKEAVLAAEGLNQPKTKAKKEKDNSDDEDNNAVDDFYDMDDYDDEPTDIVSSIQVEDLILENPDHDDDSNDEDTEDEEDEFAVRSTDNLMLVGHVEDDACMLEVYVFNNDHADLFVLHHILLPSYPTCIEWLDYDPKNANRQGHYAAVGGMTPQIDVWDLNVTGCLEPAFSLGAKKKKGMRHKEAVVDLAWNQVNRNVIASGSADNSVILWNLADLSGLSKFSVFEGRVQSLKWHPVETHNLLTGSSDSKVRLFDCRSTCTFKTWSLDSEVEKIIWNKFDPVYFYVGTESGMVYCVDVRHPKPVWSVKAHNKEISGLVQSSHCADVLLTGSEDQMVKVWDLKDKTPSLVATKDMGIGSIYSLTSNPDVPYVFCAGGNKKDNNVYVWDVRENEAIVERFRDRHLDQVNVQPKIEVGTDEMEVEPEPSSSDNAALQSIFSSGSSLKDGRFKKTKKRNDQ